MSPYIQTVARAADAVTRTVATTSQRAGQAMIDAGKEAVKVIGDKAGPVLARGKEVAAQGIEKANAAMREADIASKSWSIASTPTGKAAQGVGVITSQILGEREDTNEPGSDSTPAKEKKEILTMMKRHNTL